MFVAINTELEDLRAKIDLEKIQLEQIYEDCLNTKEYSAFFDFKINYEENSHIYEVGYENLLYHYVNKTDINVINENIDKYKILKYQYSYYRYLELCLDYNQHETVFRLLEIAERNRWVNYQFFEIVDRIKSQYYTGN